MNHVTMIDTNCTREEFTRHGQHMNSAGKEKLARNIGQVITHSLTAQTSSISLNWEEASSIIPNKEALVQPSTESADDEHKTVIRASDRTKKAPSTRNEDFLWPT